MVFAVRGLLSKQKREKEDEERVESNRCEKLRRDAELKQRLKPLLDSELEWREERRKDEEYERMKPFIERFMREEEM